MKLLSIVLLTVFSFILSAQNAESDTTTTELKKGFKRFQFSCVKNENVDFISEDDFEKLLSKELNCYFYKEYSELDDILEKGKKLLVEQSVLIRITLLIFFV